MPFLKTWKCLLSSDILFYYRTIFCSSLNFVTLSPSYASLPTWPPAFKLGLISLYLTTCFVFPCLLTYVANMSKRMSQSRSRTHNLRTATCGLPINCFLLRTGESPSIPSPPGMCQLLPLLEPLVDRDSYIYQLF